MTSDDTTQCDEVIGVVGLGALGRGIVACCLSRGFAVVGIDREQSNREMLRDYLPEAAAQCVEAGVIDDDDTADWQARLELSGDFASIGRACLVIEAIPEHPGFLCNRTAYAMYREAVQLLESGVADAASIDRSFRNSVGPWAAMCGPLRVIDVMGGGAFYAESIKGVLPTLANSTELPDTLQSLIDRNAKGPKNNIGFFPYAEGDEAEWAKRFTAAILGTKRYQDHYFDPQTDVTKMTFHEKWNPFSQPNNERD